MDIIYPLCTGLDVHQRTVVACCVTRDGPGRKAQETRTFATMTPDLLALSDWLQEAGVTHVAMESTGEYWKPVYNILEESFTLLLVNARHIKAVPGRKTNVKDAEWIADLLLHGLLRPIFVLPPAQRELRDLCRHHSNFVRQWAALVNRVQKVPEGANIKLASVAHLDTVPGVVRAAAELIVSEISTDMSRFPMPGHLADWAGVAPGNNESACQAGVRYGNRALKAGLVQAAQAAARTKSYLSAHYHRLAAHRGKKWAILAVAHSLLVIAYRLIERGENYRKLG